MVQVGQLDASCHGWVSARNERNHPAGPDSRERGREQEGQPPKKLIKTFGVANIVRQVLQIERHFDLGLGTWTPTASIHAGGMVNPNVGDILPKRLRMYIGKNLTLRSNYRQLATKASKTSRTLSSSATFVSFTEQVMTFRVRLSMSWGSS